MKKQSKLQRFIIRLVFFILCILVIGVANCVNHKEREKEKQTEKETSTTIKPIEHEYTKEKFNALLDKFKTTYDIDITYGNSEIVDIPYEYTLSKDERLSYSALVEIEKIINRLPDKLIEETCLVSYGDLGDEQLSGLKIFLCDSLEDDEVVGATAYNDNYDIILIEADEANISRTFAHELFHFTWRKFIEYNLFEGKEDDTLLKWDAENPPEFKYAYYEGKQVDSNSYTTLVEKNPDNVYFVTSYAKKKTDEDMCETFSYLLATDEDEDIIDAYKSPHIKEKSRLIVNLLDNIFDCVDENAYWTRIYKSKVE